MSGVQKETESREGAVAEEKLEELKQYFIKLGDVLVAYSSGVDSTFLLKVAHDVLGERAVAVTVQSCLFPGRESAEAEDFCKKEGIRQIICNADEMEIPGFSGNPKDRCYLCKKDLFEKIGQIAAAIRIEHIAEGSNVDDMGDYRPGLRAVAELGILSPLREVGLTKAEIRYLSRKLGLVTWEKPSFACLASRFVYGETITKEKLGMVEQAEQLLLDLGFRQMRVRIHGTMARIEVLPEEIERLASKEIREVVTARFREYGFTYIAMDLAGYRTGSMNEIL
ncbi:ATP-dependent sacrificial sulfur transferase LarE [Roseburia hominis]